MRNFINKFAVRFFKGINFGVVSIILFVLTLAVLDLSIGSAYDHTVISLLEKLK